ncbi:MAG: type I glyceraldehyde-3-phosphate dehydrogenase [Chitinophagales bacterium]|nr:type I glyceraldehyde-3-phosphate dehydrogenase [Bacteroidota bacterium]
MKKIRIAVNGFGRIGRLTTRFLVENPMFDLVAINDLTDKAALAHLFKYDTAQGKFSGTVSASDNYLIINGDRIQTFAERDPALLPWKDLNVDVVLEATGRFTDKEKASLHLQAGARKVLISAPAKGGVKTIVIGVNDHELTANDNIISNASCTTNCLAPMVKILDDMLGIEQGLMTTIHAYTADQNLQDGPHRDLRRARAAAQNIVPTSTGAASAVGQVLPHLNGKLNGVAMRVPTITGSLTDFTALVRKKATADEVNAQFKHAASQMKEVLQYSDEPLVSSDIIGNTHSCIFDSELTMVQDNMVKITGWYDNEAGYSSRLAHLAAIVSAL